MLARAADVFGGPKPKPDQPALKDLHAKIGQLPLENDVLEGALTKAGLLSARRMIDHAHALPVVRQCQLLAVARSTAYYQPRAVSVSDLALIRLIDELHLDSPFAGARMLRDLLRGGGHPIGRKRVRSLLARMSIEALYRKPTTSRRHPTHPVYPYRLRNRASTRLNQVWTGFRLPLCGRTGRAAGYWRSGCVQYADHRLLSGSGPRGRDPRYGAPDIFNTDHGSQFTSLEFTTRLNAHGIQISMDGIGCWRDNVCVEWLGRSVKYEAGYWHACASVSAVRHGLERYLTFYNRGRHPKHWRAHTPDEVSFAQGPALRTAV